MRSLNRWALLALVASLALSFVVLATGEELAIPEIPDEYDGELDEYDEVEFDEKEIAEVPSLPYPQSTLSTAPSYSDLNSPYVGSNINYPPLPIVPTYSSQPAYQPQVVSSYQPPVVSSYQPPVVSSYQPPVVSSYQPSLTQSYSPPVVNNYVAPSSSYGQSSSYNGSYSGSQSLPYGPAVANYSRPVQTTTYAQQPQILSRPYQGNFNVTNLISQYSIGELATIVPFFGYRANHWSLSYYRQAPYRQCPKNVYQALPTYRDIESAFYYAIQQLSNFRHANVNYLNSTTNSFAARHSIFSLLAQTNARLDEEGLLLELVSQYLAERACLTKWDKQRYLPSLTKFISVSNFPQNHSCANWYNNQQYRANALKTCVNSKYRTFDGFCNNPYHPYWGKSNICHIRLLSPDYADGISAPRVSYNSRYPLPNPRSISTYIHNDIPLESPYNLMKMQWGQLINHDITNTALASYDGLVDCCKSPNIRGCWPIYVQGDRFYGAHNITCLNFMRSGVCPTCTLGPRQQLNKNTAFLDLSMVYGQNIEQANQLRAFSGGLLRSSLGKGGEVLLPVAVDKGQEQCAGTCFLAGDTRVNQHPSLTALQTLLLRSHNQHAFYLARRHPDWNDEYLFQEARRLNIAIYQMITYNEYLPIVFGPILSSYYKLAPQRSGYTYFEPKADPTTWNEYVTASCRFGHSQISSVFGLYSRLYSYGSPAPKEPTFRLKEWFMRPSLLSDGLLSQMVLGLLGRQSNAVDPWVTTDVANHLYQGHKEHTGGDLAATNIWRGREHGIPGYIHYVEYCFNIKIRSWKDLSIFIPYYTLNQLRKIYRVVDNIDLFTGGLSERHFPGADTGPTFACINGIQYYHLKFGDRYYFEHGNQPGSFSPVQLDEIRRSGTLAKFLCQTAKIYAVPQYAFMSGSQYNPIVNCSQIPPLNYNLF